MNVAHSETAKNDPNCEIRLGVASWDDGSNTAQSVKYTGFDKAGKAKRWVKFQLRPFPKCSPLRFGNGI